VARLRRSGSGAKEGYAPVTVFAGAAIWQKLDGPGLLVFLRSRRVFVKLIMHPILLETLGLE
jgi:hypothetical protein